MVEDLVVVNVGLGTLDWVCLVAPALFRQLGRNQVAAKRVGGQQKARHEGENAGGDRDRRRVVKRLAYPVVHGGDVGMVEWLKKEKKWARDVQRAKNAAADTRYCVVAWKLPGY